MKKVAALVRLFIGETLIFVISDIIKSLRSQKVLESSEPQPTMQDRTGCQGEI